jgi:hypothetical protein
MKEMAERRSLGLGKSSVPTTQVDSILDGYFVPGPERRHRSPTKRLISHKNSTWEHKKRICEGI